jgi:predicted DNA-binding transcriptional regulator AlpA
MAKPHLILPHDKLGLSRNEAACYIGVSSPMFDEMVLDGRMPQPKLINGLKVWSRNSVEKAFAELSEDGQNKPRRSPWADIS